jgi:hypothetical protein
MVTLRTVDLLEDDIDFEFLDDDVEDNIVSLLDININQGFGSCPVCTFSYAIKGSEVPSLSEVRIDDIEFMITGQSLQPTKQGLRVTANGMDKIQYFLNRVPDARVLYVSSPQDPTASPYQSKLKHKAPIRWKQSNDIFGADGWSLYDQGGGSVRGYSGKGIVHDFLGLLNCPYGVFVDPDIPNVDISTWTFLAGARSSIGDLIRTFVSHTLSKLTRIHIWGEWPNKGDGRIYISDSWLSGGVKGKLPDRLMANSQFRMASGGNVMKIHRSRGPVLINVGSGIDDKVVIPPCAETGYRADDPSSDITESSVKLDIQSTYKDQIDEAQEPPDESKRQEIKQKGGQISVLNYVKLPDGKKLNYKEKHTTYGRLAGETSVREVWRTEIEREYAHLPNGLLKETIKNAGMLFVGSGSNAVPKWYENLREETKKYSYTKSDGSAEKIVGKSGTLQKRLTIDIEVKGCVGYTTLREDKDRPPDPSTGKSIIIYENKTDAGTDINRTIAFQNVEEGVLIKKCTLYYGSESKISEYCYDGQTGEIISKREYITTDTVFHDKAGCVVWPSLLTIYLEAEEGEDGYEVDGLLKQDKIFSYQDDIGIIPNVKSKDELESYLKKIRSFNYEGRMRIMVGKPITIKEGNPCFSYNMRMDYTRPAGTTEIMIQQFFVDKP